MKQNIMLLFPLLLISILIPIISSIPVPENYENNLENSESLNGNVRKILYRCLIPCDRTGNDPICGTDGRDYTSPKELICYQMCGKKIQVAYYGKCNDSSSTMEV